MSRRYLTHTALTLLVMASCSDRSYAQPTRFFETHCYGCHEASVKKGGLDLSALKNDATNPENFARWLKIHDRIESGEMPPTKKKPPAADVASALKSLHGMLVKAEQVKLAKEG